MISPALGRLSLAKLAREQTVETAKGWMRQLAFGYLSLSPPEMLAPALTRDGLRLAPFEETVGMPFDHDLILAAALERLRGKGAFSDLPARFLAPEFTLAELHEVYQIALGERLNIDAFRRKVLDRGFVEETGNLRRMPSANRPSMLYRLVNGHSVFDRRI